MSGEATGRGARKRDLPMKTQHSRTAQQAGEKRRPGAAGDTAPLPAAIEQQINENLKRLYEQQLQQDLPERLQDLVAQLRSGEAGEGGRAG